MVVPAENPSTPNVLVIADVDSNAQAIVERILKPSGFNAWVRGSEAPDPDVLVVDVTQLRGDPMANLRNYRAAGDSSPAILLAAHFPLAKLRELFRMGVHDFLLKPYRPSELCQAITELSESRSTQADASELSDRMERLREQLRRRTEEIRMLSEIGRVVVDLNDLNEILRSVVEAAAFVTDAEEASIYLAEPDDHELVLRASKQAGERHATLQKLRSTDTLVGEVYQTGKPLLRQPSLEGGPVKVQTGFLVQSTVNVPLRVKDSVVGVLGVYNRLASRSFTEHHLTLLMALADWAGVALEQASLKRTIRTQPLQREAPPPTKPRLGVSSDLMAGLQRVTALLEHSRQDADPSQVKTLDEALSQLKALQSEPVVHIDPEKAEQLVDLPKLIAEAVDSMRPVARQKGLLLNAEQADPIPLFEGDKEKVRQVLEALVAAAIRRTKRGRVILETHRFEVLRSQSDEFPLTVNVEMHDGAWAAVRVSDSSPGLSPDTVQAITAGDTNPLSGSMGPGLSMGEIRMIVESMNGVMWYEHTPASTSITFALPIRN
jgi:signal transduction histidine kinase/FixJ family two-component response regulator